MFSRRKPSPEQPPAALPPPSLFDPTKLDLITQSSRDGIVSLYIIQDEPWTSLSEEIESLSEKLSMYAAYVLEGQLAEQYPHMAGRAWRIVIDSYTGRPNDQTMTALYETGDDLSGLGGELIFHELRPPTPGAKLSTTLRSVRLRTTESSPSYSDGATRPRTHRPGPTHGNPRPPDGRRNERGARDALGRGVGGRGGAVWARARVRLLDPGVAMDPGRRSISNRPPS